MGSSWMPGNDLLASSVFMRTYLMVNQINYTLPNVADHTEPFSHQAINR